MTAPYHRWTIRELNRLREMAEAGKTRREAAKLLELSVDVVRAASRWYDVRFVRAPHQRHDDPRTRQPQPPLPSLSMRADGECGPDWPKAEDFWP